MPHWFTGFVTAMLVLLGSATAQAQIKAQPPDETPAQAPADNRVDLLLALGADVSRSVDDGEFRLQRDGYASGLSHPKVLEAIQSGGLGRIAVMYYEWSGADAQRVIIDWTVIANAADARRFGERLASEPRAFMDRTAIGAAIQYGMVQLDRSPFQAPRRVIDISGDGTNNNGTSSTSARDAAIEMGVIINGLVILSPEPLPWNPAHTHPPGGLETYFKENVVGGPGSFTMVAESFDTFNKAILAKLIREIALGPDQDDLTAAIARN